MCDLLPKARRDAPAPHAAARGGRRRGGFQTRPRPHHQNSPRRSRLPPVSPAAHHRPIPTVKPARRPRPHAAARGGRRRGGFQTRPCPHHQNSPRRSRPPPVSPAAHHRPIPTVEPARRPRPHAAARGGRRRGGFQTRPCPHHQNSPRRSRPPVPPTAHHEPIPAVEPARKSRPHTASRRVRRRGGFQTRPCPHQQNSPRRSHPPSVPPTAHHKSNPAVEPARRPGPPRHVPKRQT